MKTIPVSHDHIAFVDDEDYNELSQHKWYFNSHGAGYAVCGMKDSNGKWRNVVMHRMIMKVPDGIQIDHINRNGLDNRKENLRFATVQTNAFNRKKPAVRCTSKYKGVLQRKGADYWLARIKYNDKHVELGRFSSEEVAASAYNYASEIFFGSYRCENNSAALPQLTEEMKYVIFCRCKNKIDREHWEVITPEYIRYKEIWIPENSIRIVHNFRYAA